MIDNLDEMLELARKTKVRRPTVPEGFKFCNGCQAIKTLGSFNIRNDRSSADKNGRVSRCIDCLKQAAKDWYYRDHEKVKESARAKQYLRRHEGRITKEEAASLAQSNIGYCDLCSEYGMIMVDHDHVTEARRGFLCSRCNFALGGFKDDPELLQKAAAYLICYREPK